MSNFQFSDAEADKADAKRERQAEAAREYREMAAQAAMDRAVERSMSFGYDD